MQSIFFLWGQRKLTGNSGAPLTQTLSANRTRLGRLLRNFSFRAGESSVDLRPGEHGNISGWHTNKLTCVSHARTN